MFGGGQVWRACATIKFFGIEILCHMGHESVPIVAIIVAMLDHIINRNKCALWDDL